MDIKSKELIAKRALEDRGFVVHDANVLFRENCPNIDLVVYGRHRATYIQVKTSSKPATKDFVTVCGSPWSEDQLFNKAPIFNKQRDGFQAAFVMLVEIRSDGEVAHYLVPPADLTGIAVRRGRSYYKKPKKDGSQRKMFRKEVHRDQLTPWREAWHLLGN